MSDLSQTIRHRRGIALGRFQPPHLEHLSYLAAASERCYELVIGITEPRPNRLLESSSAPHRHAAGSNPYSFYERVEMIRAGLFDIGADLSAVTIVPAPWADMEMVDYLPAPDAAVCLVTVLDEWGLERIGLLESVGFSVEVLPTSDRHGPSIRASEVRSLARAGRPIDGLVSPGVRELIYSIGVDRLDTSTGSSK